MIKLEFNKLDKAEIIQRFTNWHSLIERGASIDEMKNPIRELISGCIFETFPITSAKFFRARKNKGEERIDKISELWYPNDPNRINIGRANRKGSQALYISQDGRTTIYEIGLEAEDCVTVSQLAIKENQKIKIIYLYFKDVVDSIPFENLFQKWEAHLYELGFNKKGVENINLTHKLLSQEFLRTDDKFPEKAYTISAAVAEILLSDKDVDGMAYPSTRSINDFNIVLKKESADRALEIKRCDSFRIVSKGKQLEDVILNHVQTTESIDVAKGIINWTNDITDDLDWNSSGTEALIRMS